jgi:hypothetical protein
MAQTKKPEFDKLESLLRRLEKVEGNPSKSPAPVQPNDTPPVEAVEKVEDKQPDKAMEQPSPIQPEAAEPPPLPPPTPPLSRPPTPPRTKREPNKGDSQLMGRKRVVSNSPPIAKGREPANVPSRRGTPTSSSPRRGAGLGLVVISVSVTVLVSMAGTLLFVVRHLESSRDGGSIASLPPMFSTGTAPSVPVMTDSRPKVQGATSPIADRATRPPTRKPGGSVRSAPIPPPPTLAKHDC